VGNRRIKAGYTLLDALFTLFLSTIVVASVLGLFALFSRHTVKTEQIVQDYLEERTDHAWEKKVIFTRD